MQLADAIEQWALDNASSLGEDDRQRLRRIWSVVRRAPAADITIAELTEANAAVVIDLFDEGERATVASTLNTIVASRRDQDDDAFTPESDDDDFGIHDDDFVARPISQLIETDDFDDDFDEAHDHRVVSRSLPADVAKAQPGAGRRVMWSIAFLVLALVIFGVGLYVYFVGI